MDHGIIIAVYIKKCRNQKITIFFFFFFQKIYLSFKYFIYFFHIFFILKFSFKA